MSGFDPGIGPDEVEWDFDTPPPPECPKCGAPMTPTDNYREWWCYECEPVEVQP